MREVRMTFGEHLEELRRRIMASLLWLSLATVLCFILGDRLMDLTMGPHERAVLFAKRKTTFQAMQKTAGHLDEIREGKGVEGRIRWETLFTEEIRKQYAKSSIASRFDRLAAELALLAPDDQAEALKRAIEGFGAEFSNVLMDLFSPESKPIEEQNYLERFRRLREDLQHVMGTINLSMMQQVMGFALDADTVQRPLGAFVAFLEERSRAILERPPSLQELPALVRDDAVRRDVASSYLALSADLEILKKSDAQLLKVMKYPEALMAYFKVALIFALLISLPLILYEMWKFVGAGLYEQEQRYVLIFLPFSIAFFLLGALFGYWWMVPIGLQFLASWGSEYAEISFTLESYIGLFFTLTIVLGLVFQTPLVMLFLHRIGIVSASGFAAARKYTLLGALVFSIIVTPPDPLSWFFVTAPIMLLYELGIQIAKRLERRKSRAASSEAPASS